MIQNNRPVRDRQQYQALFVVIISFAFACVIPSVVTADPLSIYLSPEPNEEAVLSESLVDSPELSLPEESPALENEVEAIVQGPSEPKQSAALPDPLEKIKQSIVTVDAEILEIARTGPMFGLKRQGSGVVIDAGGLIATAGYIIAEASSVTVTFTDGNTSSAEIVAYDEVTGLGLLRANRTKPTTPIVLGKSADLKPEQLAIILPAGGEPKAKTVKIGKIKKFTGGWEYSLDNAIHTYPPSTNFSGAPLISEMGELLGIGALVSIDIDIDPKVRVPGNIFIPIDALTSVIGELLTDGRSQGSLRPWLGLDSKQTKKGIVVSAVIAEGPAAQSGIQPGDKIVAIDQKQVSSLAEMYEMIWSSHAPGDKVHLLIVRDNQFANVPVQTIDHYDWLRLQQNMDTAITEMTE